MIPEVYRDQPLKYIQFKTVIIRFRHVAGNVTLKIWTDSRIKEEVKEIQSFCVADIGGEVHIFTTTLPFCLPDGG